MLFGQDVETKPLPAADTTASDDLENILDHLEKKMTDRENLETPDDKQVPQKKGLAGPRKASDLKPQNEKADRKTVKQQQTMKAIQSKINEYDNATTSCKRIRCLSHRQSSSHRNTPLRYV
jgi:hypothetical protein